MIDNEDRIEYAQIALQAYRKKRGGDTDKTDIQDLLSDLLHLAHSKNIYVDQMIKNAEMNFNDQKFVNTIDSQNNRP